MAKWNAHRKARLISSPPRRSRSSYPFVRPARPLPSLPNDFTALVNTVVRFESPLAPRSPRRSNKESDCTFIFSAFCSKLSRNKSGGRGAPQPPPLSCGGGERADGRSVGRTDGQREGEGGGSVFFSPSQPSVEAAHKMEAEGEESERRGASRRAGRTVNSNGLAKTKMRQSGQRRAWEISTTSGEGTDFGRNHRQRSYEGWN